MTISNSVPADFDSVSLPEELRVPLAVATNLIDTSISPAAPRVSENASSSTAASGEAGAEESQSKEGLSIEVRVGSLSLPGCIYSLVPQDGLSSISSSPAGSVPPTPGASTTSLGERGLGLFGFLNPYQNPWTRFSPSIPGSKLAGPPISAAPPSNATNGAAAAEEKKDETTDPSSSDQEGSIPGGLTTSNSASSTFLATMNEKRFSLSALLIVALIAFLMGSLLRSLLSPADFVFLGQQTTDIGVAEAIHGDKAADPDSSHLQVGAWRELRRLIELKYVFGGWDLQLAVVRRH